ncbi:MAG: rod shape-determining protein RodA [Flavobacteriaceae bacterium]|nr:rod shape-determining protein RodA [Flavobacteriaceae bacterium]
MIGQRKNRLKLDWIIISIYLLLVGFGVGNILSSSISGEEIYLFDFTKLYGKQFIYAFISLFVGFIVISIDVKFYERFSSLFYLLSLILLVCLFLFGKRVNGALSWFPIGSFNLQPSEFVKITVALAVSKYISDYQTDLRKISDQAKLFLIILIPILIIILQNDTGSSIVFFSLFLVLYREGISQNYIKSIFAIIILSIITLKFSLLISSVIAVLFTTAYYFFKGKTKNKIIKIIVVSFLSLTTCFATTYTYNNILKNHQRNYIKVWLNLEKDPLKIKKMEKTILYNLNESKKAISSGGLTGKGYLKGTRTMGNFVPAQHSDYIFSTVGEEWGFFGSIFIIFLYTMLILRILYLSEIQKNKFSRVYGYSTASILFIHFLINIGMVLGLTPTIGIPLPFLSYGGSSLIAFTILLFIFLRLDANKINEW